MTFEEFQATRVWSDNLAHDAPDYCENGTLGTQGFIYGHPRRYMVIERTADNRWFLLLGNQQWTNGDLETLERKLHEAAPEGAL